MLQAEDLRPLLKLCTWNVLFQVKVTAAHVNRIEIVALYLTIGRLQCLNHFSWCHWNLGGHWDHLVRTLLNALVILATTMIQCYVLLQVRWSWIAASGGVRLRVRAIQVLHLATSCISVLSKALWHVVRSASCFIFIYIALRGLFLYHALAWSPKDTFFLRSYQLSTVVFFGQNLWRLLRVSRFHYHLFFWKFILL